MTKTDAQVLSDNLYRLMAYAELRGERETATPEALEEVSGVSRSNIYRYLNMETSPSLDKLGRLANAFGLQIWQLLTPGLDPTNPPVVFVTEAEQALYKSIRTVGAQARKLEGGGLESDSGTTGSDRNRESQTAKGRRGRPRKNRVRFP